MEAKVARTEAEKFKEKLNNQMEEFMQKYECNICGYVYDPAVGDEENGIAPGISFEDLPDDWVCPECGAVKDEFSPID